MNGGNGGNGGMAKRMAEWQNGRKWIHSYTYVLFTVHANNNDDDTDDSLIFYSIDNTSSILLEVNGKKSSGKCTRHINIRYFLIADAVNKKECKILWIPQEGMYADYMKKSSDGSQVLSDEGFYYGGESYVRSKK